jgi:hypothetical protein
MALEEYEWTPKRVGDELVDALRWAQASAGQVGPRGAATVEL